MKSPEGYREEIKSLYDEGKSVDEISKLFNKDKRTIQAHLRNMGVVRRSRKGEIKCDKEYINKLTSMYNDGYNSREIGEILCKSEKTICYHLKKHNITIRPLKKIDDDKFIELWKSGKTDEEIAKYFKCEITTIKSYRTRGDNAGKYNIIRYFSQEEHKLSYLQKQMVLGSLLGDLNLSNPNVKGDENSRLAIVHCKKQEELFMKKVEILGEFMGNYRYCTPKPDSRTGKVYNGYRGNSKAHNEFTDIYNILYKNGKKTITCEYLNMIDHPIALAYLFMDDGSRDGVIATMSFSLPENILISEWLYERWGIETSIQSREKWPKIYIKQNTRLKFEKLIFPYMVKSMYYKLYYLSEILNENKMVS